MSEAIDSDLKALMGAECPDDMFGTWLETYFDSVECAVLTETSQMEWAQNLCDTTKSVALMAVG